LYNDAGIHEVKFMGRRFEHEGRTEFRTKSVLNKVSVW